MTTFVVFCLLGSAIAFPYSDEVSNGAIAGEGMSKVEALLEKLLDSAQQRADEDDDEDGEQVTASDYDTSESCIEALRVLIETGNKAYAGFNKGTHHIVIQLTDGEEVKRDLEHGVKKNEPYTKDFDDLGCIRRSDISALYLEAGNDDGWFIAEVITQAKYQDQNDYVSLTSDVVFNKWLDTDRTNNHYDPKNLSLNLLGTARSGFFSDFQISGTTSDETQAGFKSDLRHYIVFHLTDGEEKFEIYGDIASRGEAFTKDFSVKSHIKVCDIKKISLDSGNDDGWMIADITTSYYDSASSSYVTLTKNSDLNKWLDGDQPNLSYDATHIPLRLFWQDSGVSQNE